MFGLNKIKEAKKMAEQMRSDLDALQFEGESLNGMVRATCNGSKELQNVQINESAFKVRPQEEVEQMVVEAVNDAFRLADLEARKRMSDIMPNIPGLDL